jgi:phosphopantothenoylcysteine decarboxylase/phosphopantothenate--cysteine ligase
MDLDMYKHLYNSYFKALHEFGNTIIPAESGELASGLSGREEWQNLQLFLVF